MSDEIRLIKKYPNRRLYDTATSSYITLADVKQPYLMPLSVSLPIALVRIGSAALSRDLNTACAAA